MIISCFRTQFDRTADERLHEQFPLPQSLEFPALPSSNYHSTSFIVATIDADSPSLRQHTASDAEGGVCATSKDDILTMALH